MFIVLQTEIQLFEEELSHKEKTFIKLVYDRKR